MKSEEDVSERSKNYEKNKRQRAFQNSRKQGRKWLVFDDNAMFCSVCKEATEVNPQSNSEEALPSAVVLPVDEDPEEALDAEIVGCTGDEERDSGDDDSERGRIC